MFNDRIVVESPGDLPGIVRLNNMREIHFSRNPKIAAFLHEYEYVQEFGEGVDRMYTKRYREARLMNKIKLTDMADKPGISQPTLSAWESERKAAPIEAIIKMADIYCVTVDYLLGRDDVMTPVPNEPISQQVLMIYNGKPVWSEKYGWLLVRSADQQLLSYDGSTIPFADADQLFIAPPLFAEPKYLMGEPLTRPELGEQIDLWV